MQGVLPSACNGIDNSDWGRPICSVCLAIFKLPLCVMYLLPCVKRGDHMHSHKLSFGILEKLLM